MIFPRGRSESMLKTPANLRMLMSVSLLTVFCFKINMKYFLWQLTNCEVSPSRWSRHGDNLQERGKFANLNNVDWHFVYLACASDYVRNRFSSSDEKKKPEHNTATWKIFPTYSQNSQNWQNPASGVMSLAGSLRSSNDETKLFLLRDKQIIDSI